MEELQRLIGKAFMDEIQKSIGDLKLNKANLSNNNTIKDKIQAEGNKTASEDSIDVLKATIENLQTQLNIANDTLSARDEQITELKKAMNSVEVEQPEERTLEQIILDGDF